MDKKLIATKKDDYWFHSLHSFKGCRLVHDAIIIDNDNFVNTVNHINSNNITKVIVDLKHSNISDLSFLKNISNLEHLKIIGNGEVDYSSLYQLGNLKSLSLLNPSNLSLKPFINLELFSSDCAHRISDIDQAKSLKSLILSDYDQKMDWVDLSKINNLVNLDTLEVNGFRISNLKGIEFLAKLQVLLLNNLSELVDLEQIKFLSGSLTNLRLYRCNSLENISSISSLTRLRFLSLDNLTKIDKIDFVASLPNLSTFISLDSHIIDGNLSALLGVNHVVILPPRKHYYVVLNTKPERVTTSTFNYGDRITGDDEIEFWRRIAY